MALKKVQTSALYFACCYSLFAKRQQDVQIKKIEGKKFNFPSLQEKTNQVIDEKNRQFRTGEKTAVFYQMKVKVFIILYL